MSKSKNPTTYLEQAAQCCLFTDVESSILPGLLTREGVSVGHFARGEVIYAPDGFLRSLGIILSGSAVVKKKEGDASMLMSVLTEDDLFGAATLFSDWNSYVATITAEQSTWALLITETAFRQIMREDFTVAENYMRYLTRRIRFLSGRIDGFVRPGCEERVLQYLRHNTLNEKTGMTAMAGMLSISRASLYRVLDALEARGAIIRTDGHIELVKGESE